MTLLGKYGENKSAIISKLALFGDFETHTAIWLAHLCDTWQDAIDDEQIPDQHHNHQQGHQDESFIIQGPSWSNNP